MILLLLRNLLHLNQSEFDERIKQLFVINLYEVFYESLKVEKVGESDREK